MVGVKLLDTAPEIKNFTDISFISQDDIDQLRIVTRAPPLLSQAKASMSTS
jgi:hypothetical protein